MRSVFFRQLKDRILNNKVYKQIDQEDILAKQQFILFRIFSFTGALVSAGIFIKMAVMFTQLNALAYILPLLSAIILINFYRANHANVKSVYSVVLLASFTILHIVAYSTGGIRSASMLYYPVVILYSFMLLGKKGGQFFSVLFLVQVSYNFVMSRYTHLITFDFLQNNNQHIEEDFLFNAIAMVILLATHSNYLNSGRNIVLKKITEQRDELAQKNILLKKSNNFLEKSNQELDKFAYVVSHDLKAPLRAIGSLTGILEDEVKDQINAEAKSHIKIIFNRVSRMEGLINGILSYSKIVKTKEELVKIDLLSFILETAELIDVTKYCKVITPKNLVIETNKTKLQQVVLNLISNAIRHCDKEIPNIRIEAFVSNKVLHFSVEDNGPGIEQKYHEKIFVIFQTLKPRDEFETTGIGLSIVKRILDDIEGKVSISSTLGKGSIFKVEWPLSNQLHHENFHLAIPLASSLKQEIN